MSGAPAIGPRLIRRFGVYHTFYAPVASVGVNDDGYAVQAQEQAVEAIAFIHHSPNKSHRRNPEGTQMQGRIHGYAMFDVQPSDELSQRRGHRVDFAGNLYEVDAVTIWQGGPTGAVVWREFDAGLVRR